MAIGGGGCGLLFWLVTSRSEWVSGRLLASASEKWQQEDYLGAIHDYEQIIEKYPESGGLSEAYYSKGEIYFLSLDKPKEAAASLEAFLARHPEQAGADKLLRARRHLAEIYEKKLDRPIEAIAVYEALIEAIDGQEERDRYRYHIGEIYAEMGDMAQARVEWDLLVEGNPESRLAPAALYRKGGSYFVSERCQEALRVYKKLYERYPDHEMSRYGKFRAANCLEMNKQPEQALQLYQELEGLYPDADLIARKQASLKRLLARR